VTTGPLRTVVTLALAYWAAAIALGMVLGTARTLWLAPRTGALAAVLSELPVMLAASWAIARRLLAWRPLPSRGAALATGLAAFALLLASEALLGGALGLTLRQWAASLATPPGAAGLAGQALYALLPAAAWRAARADGRPER
jgi:hypothetical protein